jgi:hypothetical protein
VLIHFGDVHVGAVRLRNGNPTGTEAWVCRCGFIRAAIPAECKSGTAATFEHPRADFESAWRVFLSKRTGADFQAWREQRDWTAKKYRRFDRGDRMPHDWRMRARSRVRRCLTPRK